MSEKRTTIKDIANEAGVSVMTVSYVLNNTPGQKISEATSRRVREAADRLHYVPSHSARALRTRRTYTMGILTEYEIAHRRYASTIDGIRSGLNERGYNGMLLSIAPSDGKLPDFVSRFMEFKYDGLIYLGRDGVGIPGDTLALIKEYRIPVTAMDCKQQTEGISTVDFDYEGSGKSHVRYLASLGIRKVVYIRPDAATPQEEERERGVQAAVSDLGRMSLEIVRLKMETAGKRLCQFKMNSGIVESLIGIAEEVCRKEGEGTAILCSWGIFVEPVYMTVMKQNPAVHVASLSGGPFDVQIWKGLSYSVLPEYEAGRRCAALAVRKADEKTCENSILEAKLLCHS